MAKKLTPDEWPHGTSGCYTNHGCRRPECREAFRVSMAESRKKRHYKMISGEIEVEHGTDNTYTNYGCRCVPCSAARSEKTKQRREEKASA